jgi:hypothetical protein
MYKDSIAAQLDEVPVSLPELIAASFRSISDHEFGGDAQLDADIADAVVQATIIAQDVIADGVTDMNTVRNVVEDVLFTLMYNH